MKNKNKEIKIKRNFVCPICFKVFGTYITYKDWKNIVTDPDQYIQRICNDCYVKYKGNPDTLPNDREFKVKFNKTKQSFMDIDTDICIDKKTNDK